MRSVKESCVSPISHAGTAARVPPGALRATGKDESAEAKAGPRGLLVRLCPWRCYSRRLTSRGWDASAAGNETLSPCCRVGGPRGHGGRCREVQGLGRRDAPPRGPRVLPLLRGPRRRGFSWVHRAPGSLLGSPTRTARLAVRAPPRSRRQPEAQEHFGTAFSES